MRAPSAFTIAAMAAAATYLFDPDMGRRRRALLRDKVTGRLSHADEAGSVFAVDLRNRTQGLLARLRGRFALREVANEVLAERVRARLGRFLSHPGAVEVSASGGVVTLQGPVLEHEVDRALRAVSAVPGVRQVTDALERHKQAGDVSSLQGGRRRIQRADLMQERWALATRVLVGAGGATLLALARRSPLSLAFSLAGGAMLLRAGSNMPIARLLGQRGPYIGYKKTIHIGAPVQQVFAFWQDFANFPKYMRNVRAVRRNADGGWHWEVAGPLGATVQWDAHMTACVPDELIAWSTAPGSRVQHAGLVHFQREGEGTRVQVEMRYNPPGAALGHVVASLFGADPLTEMDEDLMRLKSFLETGKPARDAARAAP
ncbi:MAG: SRPBCC family protein [Betaproteobacteria bacterium]